MSELEGIFHLWAEARQDEPAEVTRAIHKLVKQPEFRPVSGGSAFDARQVTETYVSSTPVPSKTEPDLCEPIVQQEATTEVIVPASRETQPVASAIVRVTDRQRDSLEKARRKKEKREILLYGKFYKCKLQLKAIQNEILSACEKHNALLSHMHAIAKKAKIPVNDEAGDAITKGVEKLRSSFKKRRRREQTGVKQTHF